MVQRQRSTLEHCKPTMEMFLVGLRKYATVKEGCRVAGIDRSTAYTWRKKWTWFANEWEHARQEAYDSLEETGWDRAVDIDQKNDRLLQFLLKGGRKKKYSDRVETESTEVTNVTIAFTGVDWFADDDDDDDDEVVSEQETTATG